jgi:uncharacterized protein (DUF58 family)
MLFGANRPKLHLAADFVEALGYSAFRAGDQVGMLAFDADERDDLFVPARHGRGVGDEMATMLLRLSGTSGKTGGIEGLERTLYRLAGRRGLVFLVSDFHWPLGRLAAALDTLVNARVVPMVVWDRAEIEPPSVGTMLVVSDIESGKGRTLWLRRRLLQQWRDNVASRRRELAELFGKRGISPFYVEGTFDAESLSRYFMEAVV